MFADDDSPLPVNHEVPLTTVGGGSSLTPPKPDPHVQSNFEQFELVVYNQVGLVFRDKVHALASANNQGPFSVLPGHTNFISMITEAVSAHLVTGEVRKIEVGLGVLRCLNNRVEVFAGLHINKETELRAKQLQPHNLQSRKP